MAPTWAGPGLLYEMSGFGFCTKCVYEMPCVRIVVLPYQKYEYCCSIMKKMFSQISEIEPIKKISIDLSYTLFSVPIFHYRPIIIYTDQF